MEDILSVLVKCAQSLQSFFQKTSQDGNPACEKPKFEVENKHYTTDATWFKKNILTEDYGFQQSVADHLLGLRWISSFGVERSNNKFGTIHLVITCKESDQPVWDDLTTKYGEEILSFVDIKEGRGPRKIQVAGNIISSPPPPAKAGDGVCDADKTNCYGTLGIFARKTEMGQDEEVFAITCYHVLYAGKLNTHCEAYPENPTFLQLTKDLGDPDSRTKRANYVYRSATSRQCLRPRAHVLGSYYWGRYSNFHDIGIVKVKNSVKCNFQIECENDCTLTSKSDMRKIFYELGQSRHLPIQMIGYVSKIRHGKLVDCNYYLPAANGDQVFFRDGYKLEAENGGELVQPGDSGSLVLWKDVSGKWHPFAYIVANARDESGEFTVAFNLHDALQSCDTNLTPLFSDA